MNDVATKKCGQCGATKNIEQGFGVQSGSKDGRRSICKECFSDNRYGDKTKAVQALRVHDKLVAKATKELAGNLSTLSPGQIEKYERIVRLAPEHRAELQGKILEARKAEEDAQRQAAAAPSLTLVEQHFGSPILLTVDELRDKLTRAKIALGNLTAESDASAKRHVEDYITRVSFMVEQHDSQAAELAADAQETLNESVCRRVIGRVHDLYLPQIRACNTAEAKISLREQIRARKKALMAMAKTATGKDKSGADRAVVAKALADSLEKLALMCYGAKAELPTDTLENINSRQDAAVAAQEWLEKAEADRQKYWDDLRQSNPKQFERESKSLVLQVKSDGPFAATQRKTMQVLKRENPQEYERRALQALLPRRVEHPNIIYVAMEGKREIWHWPDGRLVKRGEEVTFDARMKRWCLTPGPASTELDPITATGRQKMEWYQDEMDGAQWKQRPEGSGGEYVQHNDSTWHKVGGASPWTRPKKIQFVRAEAPASPAHTELRHGKWFTLAEVQKAAEADAANPPQLLPPLPRFAVADSLALPPPITAADRIKDSREPYVWRRHLQAEKERKEREAELLRGN